jgi:hypothetical protein
VSISLGFLPLIPQIADDNRCRPRRPNPLAGEQDACAIIAWHRCTEVCQPPSIPLREKRNDDPLLERQALDGLQCLDRSHQGAALADGVIDVFGGVGHCSVPYE